MMTKEFDNFLVQVEALIDSWIIVNAPAQSFPAESKMDILDRIIKLLRLKQGNVRNNISLAQLANYSLAVTGSDKIVVKTEGVPFRDLFKDPRKPNDLQLPLLLFLLVNHKENKSVLQIIESFTNEIRDWLNPRDYEETNTGVTRCVTNIRFAANVLRSCGLIRYSDKEKYKTWKLSYFGIIVASLLYDDKWRRNNDTFHVSGSEIYDKRITEAVASSLDIIADQRRFRDVLKQVYQFGGLKFTVSPACIDRIVAIVGTYTERLHAKPTRADRADDKPKANIYVEDIFAETEKIPEIRRFMQEFKATFELKDCLRQIWH